MTAQGTAVVGSGPADEPGTPSTVPPFARRPVLGLAALVAVLLAVTSQWYGYFGDELYFIAAGQRPAWGYADQPAILPLLAAGIDRLAPGSLVVLRLPATLATAATVVLAALVARELGGRSRAQVSAAAAVAISPYLLGTGRLLATSTLDPFLWAVLLWLVVRWVRTDRDGRPDDRLLLVACLVLAVALNVKFLVLGLVAGLAVGVLVCGPRRLLARPLLWLGLAVAAASPVPTLLWQATHGWPQLQMGGVVAGESGLFGNRWQFLPRVLWAAGVVPGTVLLVVGLWALLRHPALARWRFLGVAVLVATAAFLAAGGRPYYTAGFFGLLFAAGAVTLQERPPGRWWRWTVSTAAFVVCGLLVVVTSLPIGPASARVRYDFGTMGEIGWPELGAAVGAAYRSLPPDQRDRTVIVADSYWFAAALEHDRAAQGLPAVYSAHRGYGFLGTPPDGSLALIVDVPHADPDRAAATNGSFCATRLPLPTYVAPMTSPVNDVVPMSLCSPLAPWSALWPSLRFMT